MRQLVMRMWNKLHRFRMRCLDRRYKRSQKKTLDLFVRKNTDNQIGVEELNSIMNNIWFPEENVVYMDETKAWKDRNG